MKISLQSASSFEGKHPCLGSSSIWAGQWCWRSSSCGTIDIGTLGRSQHPDLSSPQGSATPTRIGLGILSRSDKYLLDFFRLLPEKWTGLYQMISDYIYIYIMIYQYIRAVTVQSSEVWNSSPGKRSAGRNACPANIQTVSDLEEILEALRIPWHHPQLTDGKCGLSNLLPYLVPQKPCVRSSRQPGLQDARQQVGTCGHTCQIGYMRFHWASLSQFFSISPILRRWRRLVRLLQLQSGREKTRKFEPLGKDCHQVRTTGCRNSTSGGRNPKFWWGLFKRVSNQMQTGTHTHTLFEWFECKWSR